MEDLGYDTHNSMLNLGSLAIFSFLYYVKLIAYVAVVKPIYHYSKKGGYLMKSMAESLFYGEIIFMNIEAYLEFLIAGYLNINEPLTSRNGEIISIFIGWYCVFMSLVLMPVLFVFLIVQSTTTLGSAPFQ